MDSRYTLPSNALIGGGNDKSGESIHVSIENLSDAISALPAPKADFAVAILQAFGYHDFGLHYGHLS